MAADAFRDRTAIAGVGYAPFSRDSGVSTLTLAVDAITAALDVDGLATHRVGDSTPPWVVAPALGLDDLRWYLDQFGGGSVSHAIVGQAAAACALGFADVVVCYRAINARSEFRMGATGRGPSPTHDAQYQAPYGYFAPPQQFAMMARAQPARDAPGSDHRRGPRRVPLGGRAVPIAGLLPGDRRRLRGRGDHRRA